MIDRVEVYAYICLVIVGQVASGWGISFVEVAGEKNMVCVCVWSKEFTFSHLRSDKIIG